MKHNIFTTYSASPIKNVKTPIRKFNDETEEVQTPVDNNTVAPADATTVILEQIRALLLVMIIIKVLCLCFKK